MEAFETSPLHDRAPSPGSVNLKAAEASQQRRDVHVIVYKTSLVAAEANEEAKVDVGSWDRSISGSQRCNLARNLPPRPRQILNGLEHPAPATELELSGLNVELLLAAKDS